MIYQPPKACAVGGRFLKENSCIFLDLWYNKQKYVMIAL